MSVNGVKGRRDIMPPVITIFIIIFIIGITFLTRLILETEHMGRKQKAVYASSFVGNGEYTNKKKEIVELLTDGVSVANNQPRKELNTYFIFNSYLINHLISSEKELGLEKYDAIKVKINELINVMKLEGLTDFKEMSLDGRAVAIDIAREIYEICNLNINISMKGDIKEISDQYGNVIYKADGMLLRTQFQIAALIITLSAIMILFGIIIIVAKRNNNKEEVIYDGFDKKRYA